MTDNTSTIDKNVAEAVKSMRQSVTYQGLDRKWREIQKQGFTSEQLKTLYDAYYVAGCELELIEDREENNELRLVEDMR